MGLGHGDGVWFGWAFMGGCIAIGDDGIETPPYIVLYVSFIALLEGTAQAFPCLTLTTKHFGVPEDHDSYPEIRLLAHMHHMAVAVD